MNTIVYRSIGIGKERMADIVPRASWGFVIDAGWGGLIVEIIVEPLKLALILGERPRWEGRSLMGHAYMLIHVFSKSKVA